MKNGAGGVFGIPDLPGVQMSALSGRVGRLESGMAALLENFQSLQSDVRKAAGITAGGGGGGSPNSLQMPGVDKRGGSPNSLDLTLTLTLIG